MTRVARSPRNGKRTLPQTLGALAGPALLRASGALTRVRLLHGEREAWALSTHGAVIYAFWHGRMWLLASRLRDRRSGVLVSLSADGSVIAGILSRLGYQPVRGSSSRGGGEGLRELEAMLRSGRSVALTPDGPRGPRHRAQSGAVVLAARTGKPILPVSAASSPAWTLGSWDAFQVPHPGARGAIVFGDPFKVPEDANVEVWSTHLEAALNAAEEEADQEVNR